MSDDEPRELTVSWEITEDELVALVSGIEQSRIVALVKRTPHLQQVFHGFRPSRLPWGQVPSRLAHDAYGDFVKTKTLIAMWRESNQDLLNDVGSIALDGLREGIAALLARRGVENRFQVLWALRLDGREEVQEALKAGLDNELAAEASELLSLAQHKVLAAALEAAQARAAELKERLETVDAAYQDSQHLLQRKNEQLAEAEARVAKAEAELVELKLDRASFLDGIVEQDGAREKLEAELSGVQRQLTDEQATALELRKSVHDLKATLRAQAESAGREETQQKLDRALLELENERQETARLRLQLGKLERECGDAYAKRDEERQRSETLAQQLQKLEHDKEVLIEQKRKLAQEQKEREREWDACRRQLQDQTIHDTLQMAPLSELEERWLAERDAIRGYMREMVRSLAAEGKTSPSEIDKWHLWSRWLEREGSLVRAVLSGIEGAADLDSIKELEDAQQLLALRWYLLEATRQAILSALQESAFSV